MICIDIKNHQDKLILKYEESSPNEYNLCNTVNSLLCVNKFVIQLRTDSVDFNIDGRLFSFDLNIVDDYKSVYAYLTSFDDGDLDEGVINLFLSESAPTEVNSELVLHVLEKVDGKWVIPDDGKLVARHNCIEIDDGTL